MLGIIGAPAPIFGDRPQWDVGEDDNRRRGGKALHIIGKPSELLRPEIAHAAGLEVHHIVETDEMDTVLVEGIPACALGVLAVALEIGFERHFVEVIVLARHVVHVEAHAADDLRSIVEFFWLRQMGDVTGMEHECRLVGQSLNLGDGFL